MNSSRSLKGDKIRLKILEGAVSHYDDVYSDALYEDVRSQMAEIGPNEITYSGRSARFYVKKRDGSKSLYSLSIGSDGTLVFSDADGSYSVTRALQSLDPSTGKQRIDFLAMNRLLAIQETLAHLHLLQERGRVATVEQGGLSLYELQGDG